MTDGEKAALFGTFVKVGTMADGTPRITLDMDCTLSQLAALNLAPGTPLAVARIVMAHEHKPERKDIYGDHYKVLFTNGFFNNPRVVVGMGAEDIPPAERTEFMKKKIYSECAVTSLAELAPHNFFELMMNYGLDDCVPASFDTSSV